MAPRPPKEKVVHAKNPKWAGPLCRYEDGVRHQEVISDVAPQVFMVSQDPKHADVTCQRCLQRLGRIGKKDRMPNQSTISKQRSRLPVKLRLLPTARWQGSMSIIGRDNEKFWVAFDAVNASSWSEKYIYDRTQLTAEEILAWTGVDILEHLK